ncbi:MAG: NAD(P)(+) transhydrogenase (Re/Si-specific) subunit beta [Planctomycetota bacterium]|nr:NAD(P)(+) transhydrogenase (Re/Si-specific) subunit beta [Planctomycetota bacterium]
MSSTALTNLLYLIASILFIFGIKGLTHPKTAVRGNLLSALGMLLAVVVTLRSQQHLDFGWGWIIAGLVIGGAVGLVLAVKVEMTGMPQLVALFNGLGGVASAFVAGAELILRGDVIGGAEFSDAFRTQFSIATATSGLIGAVTLTGSLVAAGKLHGVKWIKDGNLIPGQKAVNFLLLAGAIAIGYWMYTNPGYFPPYALMVLVAAVLGVLLVTPIGGADMPVVIALLNSYSGLAAAATGFVINNNVLIIAGSLVGASGLVLTKIMCKAMNRSLRNVIFGTLGPTAETASADDVYAGKVKSASAEEVAMLLDGARRVVIIPGYGMAVSQAQHAVRDLANLLESRGATVEFGIHPVAGRMPGHMNVLLAEANIPYDKLLEMDVINPTLEQVDVGIVIGANDVVNPVARTDPKSPIAGMPIIDIDKCRTVVVIKRSLSPGFAGIPNPLFAADNCLMFFGDGKKAFLDLIAAVKES